MSDSMQKILEEMRSVGKEAAHTALTFRGNEWDNRIETLMQEPVAYLSYNKFLTENQFLSFAPDAHNENWIHIPLFAAPPDTQALIDAAREECLNILRDAENFHRSRNNGDGDSAANTIACRIAEIQVSIGKPLEKKP